MWVAHLLSGAILPGLPQLSVSAVVQAVCLSELLPQTSGISSLSPEQRQEGEFAQVDLQQNRTLITSDWQRR